MNDPRERREVTESLDSAGATPWIAGGQAGYHLNGQGEVYLFDGDAGRTFDDVRVCTIHDRSVLRHLDEHGAPQLIRKESYTEFTGRGWRERQARFVKELLDLARATVPQKTP